MAYLTLAAEIDHGHITVAEPDKLPVTGKALLTVPGFAYDGTVPSAMRYPRKDAQPEAGPIDGDAVKATGRPPEETQDADEEAALTA